MVDHLRLSPNKISISLIQDIFHHRWLLWLQIRTLGMLRSRFQSLPGAFNASLIPEETTDEPRKKGLKATLSRRFTEVNCFTFINT
jgi:hypothetical protein